MFYLNSTLVCLQNAFRLHILDQKLITGYGGWVVGFWKYIA